METTKKKLSLITLTLFSALLSYADIAPVRVATTFRPPYSSKISDWLNVFEERFTVDLLLRDLSISNGTVFLNMHIEGNNLKINTKNGLKIEMHPLEGGIPISVSAAELRKFFRAENLDFEGISQSDYINNGGKLPDGQYRIWFDAFEWQSGLKVSASEIPAIIWLQNLEPPIMLLPENQATIKVGTSPILFSWQAQHLGAPNATFQTAYLFEMIQIPLHYTGSPEDLFNYYPKICQETFQQNSFLYDEFFPALSDNFEYAFRVRAFNADDENAEYFKNNGYSHISRFSYFDECIAPENIQVELNNPYTAKIVWDKVSQAIEYQVNYRREGQQTEWFATTTSEMEVMLDQLTPSTRYEYQVKSLCRRTGSEASSLEYFTTAAINNSNIACGVNPPAISENCPLEVPDIQVNSEIFSGGSSIKISKINSQSDGLINGEGYASLPTFNFVKVHVVLENVLINGCKEHISGRIYAN
ncbi:hypothetical protein FACS1894178_0250 [Bacteroidia bacterium]|nr:hypothetical protein FACS1894178_0250 [Bacteroidia bacterium]